MAATAVKAMCRSTRIRTHVGIIIRTATPPFYALPAILRPPRHSASSSSFCAPLVILRVVAESSTCG